MYKSYFHKVGHGGIEGWMLRKRDPGEMFSVSKTILMNKFFRDKQNT